MAEAASQVSLDTAEAYVRSLLLISSNTDFLSYFYELLPIKQESCFVANTVNLASKLNRRTYIRLSKRPYFRTISLLNRLNERA